MKVIADAILLAAGEHTGLQPQILKGPTRLQWIAHTRQGVMLALRHKTAWSLPQIGRYLNRDHTTIIHGIEAASKRASVNGDFADLMRVLMAVEVPSPPIWLAPPRIQYPSGRKISGSQGMSDKARAKRDRAIVRSYNRDCKTQQELADYYGLSRAAISMILDRYDARCAA